MTRVTRGLGRFRRLSDRFMGKRADVSPVLQPLKTGLIDRAFVDLGLKSFADLGGVWAVEAGYTFYALERFQVDRGVLVDSGITPTVRAKARRFPQLELVDGNFGDPSVPARVGNVDAVLLFDVLLHQVAPDWDEILAAYAPFTRAFLVVNPQYVQGAETVRLLDLGRERYLELVPKLPLHDEAFDRLDEVHPGYGRPFRDIHEIWQWGIVDSDLDRVLANLGFRRVYRENGGTWFGLDAFEAHSFLYAKD